MSGLAPFSYDWIGGDIWGLDALTGQCDRVAAQLTDVSHALSRQVSSMVGAGSWTGKAADAFTAAWDKDSTAGTQLASAWTKIGSIAGRLAEELASLESALEDAAYQLEKQGVAVNTATGLPLPGVAPGGNACPDPQVAAAHATLIDRYMTHRAKILDQATRARAHATYMLYTLTEELLPPQFDWGQLTNDLDGIRGLWATPTQVRADFEKALGEKGKIDAAAWDQLLESHKVDGYNARLEKSLIKDLSKARAELADAEGKLASAPPESRISQAAAGDADGLGVLGVGGKTIKVIPFAGATAGAVIQVVQDREDHESWRHSLVDGVVSNGASLGAGIAGAAIVTGLIGGSSFVAVGVGAAAGTVAAIGVGDAVHNLIQENWGSDIDKHGVLDGIGYGVADSTSKTGHDIMHYGDDIKNFFHL